jgi:hypothetical protein
MTLALSGLTIQCNNCVPGMPGKGFLKPCVEQDSEAKSLCKGKYLFSTCTEKGLWCNYGRHRPSPVCQERNMEMDGPMPYDVIMQALHSGAWHRLGCFSNSCWYLPGST